MNSLLIKIILSLEDNKTESLNIDRITITDNNGQSEIYNINKEEILLPIEKYTRIPFILLSLLMLVVAMVNFLPLVLLLRKNFALDGQIVPNLLFTILCLYLLIKASLNRIHIGITNVLLLLSLFNLPIPLVLFGLNLIYMNKIYKRRISFSDALSRKNTPSKDINRIERI